MRQLNFLLFFVVCLALALFSIENTQTAPITIVPGVEVEAPLSIELLLAVGTGGMLAWIFSLWDQMQRQIESWKAQRQIKQQSQRIEDLEKTLAQFQQQEPESTLNENNAPSLQSLPPSADEDPSESDSPQVDSSNDKPSSEPGPVNEETAAESA